MSHSLSEIMRKRRSIRIYKDMPISKEQWQAVVEAGSFAPSTGNIQNWKFLIVTGRSKRVKIAHCCQNQVWMENAPVHIIICANEDLAKKYYPEHAHSFSIQNCAAAAQNMLLKATELGLGSCWVGQFNASQLKKQMGLDATPVAVIVLGHAGEEVPLPPKRDFFEFVYFENYGDAEHPLSDSLNRKKFSDVREEVQPRLFAPFVDTYRAIVSYIKRQR